MQEINIKSLDIVLIDPSLDQYNNTVLFPDKLAKANKQIKKSGSPDLASKKQNTKSSPKSNLKK